jgi:putative ABC transport system permease protein
VNLLDTILHAFGNLRRQRLRTALTTVGVAIGVFTTAIMMAFPAGVMNLIESKLDRQALLTTIAVLGKPVPTFPTSFDEIRRLERQQQSQKAVPLDDELVTELKGIEGVLTAYPDFSGAYTFEANDNVDWVQTEGFPLDAMTPNYKGALLDGSYWDKSSEDGDICVFPSALLSSAGFKSPHDALGKTIVLSKVQALFKYTFDPPLEKELAPGQRRKAIPPPEDFEHHELEIMGVYDSDQFGMLGSRIQMPLSLAKKIRSLSPQRKPREGQYQQLTVKVKDRHDVEAVRKQLDGRQLGTIMTTDILKVLGVVFTAIEAGLGLFGGIALLVSVFGIANTMYMAVLERTREIGILKAIGGRDADVWRSFIFEAGGIGFLGGTLGVSVGALSCLILNALATRILKDPTAKALEVFHISLVLASVLVTLATVVSMLAGLFPAWRASRLDPVEALRRE